MELQEIKPDTGFQWEWHVLCGRGVDNFTVWQDGDFGHCFEQLVFSCTTHLLLAAVSMYHFFHNAYRRVAGPLPKSLTLHCRFLVSIFLLLLPLVLVTLTFLYLKIHMSLVDIITICVKVFTWLGHTAYVWRHHRMYHVHIRGTVSVVVSFLFTAVSTGIQLRTVILHVRNHSPYLNSVETYVTYITSSLYVIYILTLIPSKRPPLTHLHYSLSVQDVDQAITTTSGSETDHLLDPSRPRQNYGGILRCESAEDQPLGIAEDFENCLSKITFYWVRSLMLKGTKGGLNRSRDLYDLPQRLRTKLIEQKFNAAFRGENWSGRQRGHSTESISSIESGSVSDVIVVDGRGSALMHSVKCCSLLTALNRTFGVEYYLLGLLRLTTDMLSFTGPILLNYLVSYMENKTEPISHGYIYASGLFGSTFICAFLSTQFNYRISVVGLKIRAAIITAVYHKTMAVSTVSLSRFSTGEVVNFMSTDTDRIVNFCPSFHQFWSLPFQVAVSLYLLHQQVGLAFLAGLAFATILIPINRWLAIKIGELSTKMMAQKDTRVKVMNEILSGIRVIKFYAWEDHFASRVNSARRAELQSLKGRKYLDALCVFFWATTPVLISILTFTTYVLLGNKLTAAKVFTSLALFNMLISPLNAFPWVINGLVEAWVSAKRVQAFTTLPDLSWYKYYSSAAGLERNTVMKIQNGSFSWRPQEQDEGSGEGCVDDGVRERGDGAEAPPTVEEGDYTSHILPPQADGSNSPDGAPVVTPRDKDELQVGTLRLQDVNIEIKQGSLVGVIGKVGSGKSSLFSAILAEMNKERGHVTISNMTTGFGLVSQEAWIQHATIRDNILFGKRYEEDRYTAVLEACALEEDLKVLPDGDLTEIGEQGMTLSGGQKARVSLARAVYQDKDVYLLDDPLAAVDAHVAKHMFNHCILGLLEGKTCLLCTHHTKYLREADVIVLMDDGHIVEMGPPSVILGDMENDHWPEESQDQSTDVHAEAEDLADTSENIPASSPLVEEEEKDTGVVKMAVYKIYWKAVGSCLAPVVLLSLLLMQVSRNINDWWLSYWVSNAHQVIASNTTVTSHDHVTLVAYQQFSDVLRGSAYYEVLGTDSGWRNVTEAEDNVQFYLMVYGILAGANSILTLARAFLFAYGGIHAATVIHWYLLKSVLKAPISFFNMTPIGRILNRFSSDLYSIDDSLPFIMNILLAQFFGVLGTIAITCYGLPWFALLLLPLGIIYYFIQRYYRQTSREIKRITSVTLSPLYAHFSESITGLKTIRAFRHLERFVAENRRRLEENQKAQFAGIAASQWLGLRLQMFGVAMVTGVAFIAVLEHHFQTVNPGLVGLAVSYALSITSLLSGLVTSLAETEKQMVSVERAGQYMSDIPSEKEESLLCMPPFWPIQGAVSFHRACLQYRPGLPLALNNVSYETQPAEKIGVVGRTGSGKSSLFLAMFRIVELQSGYVTIDGLNLAHLDIRELRARMAIIPQDPFLYSGSVRDNLDPRGLYPDSQLWTVIHRCHLATVTERLGGLDADVGEKGCHFSMGQRQLMCLGRAMLTRAKVLCIDEATASVDQETDILIQETLRSEFAHHTVITIAHRMHTILDNDRVLVMNNGRVAEFDPPGVLLENPNSIFYGLVHGQSQ